MVGIGYNRMHTRKAAEKAAQDILCQGDGNKGAKILLDEESGHPRFFCVTKDDELVEVLTEKTPKAPVAPAPVPPKEKEKEKESQQSTWKTKCQKAGGMMMIVKSFCYMPGGRLDPLGEETR